MKAPKQQNGGLASLTPECLDQLCDLIIAKLEEKNLRRLASQARRRGFESHHPLQTVKKTPVPLPELPIREILLLLLGDKARRQLLLRGKPNGELFELYRLELALTIRNERNLKRYYQVLDSFRDFLDDIPPSTLLAKQFLNQWTNSKPSTLHKYVGIIRGFMNWYGEDLDIKLRERLAVAQAYT